MATYQTTYTTAPAKGLPGQIANEEKCNKISRTVETAAGIEFSRQRRPLGGLRLRTASQVPRRTGSLDRQLLRRQRPRRPHDALALTVEGVTTGW